MKYTIHTSVILPFFLVGCEDVVRIHGNLDGGKLQRKVVLIGGTIMNGELAKIARIAVSLAITLMEEMSVQEHVVIDVDIFVISFLSC